MTVMEANGGMVENPWLPLDAQADAPRGFYLAVPE
jgi:hypothetical protein